MEIKSLKNHPRLFVTVKEAADCLAVTPKHIQNAIAKGSLPARKYGRAIRILAADFDEWVGTTGRQVTGVDRKF
jgi:excisionase family DNA binding protein